MASRRRISLGSGLNRAKLADTIAQMSLPDNDLPRSLVSNAVDHPHGWSHLSNEDGIWVIRAGYPHKKDPAELIELPGQARVREWDSELYVVVVFAVDCPADEIAQFIEYLILSVQEISADVTIQFALES